MASQRYLITGALGCIGAWATKSLLAEGAEIWSYDLPGKPHRLQLLLDDAQLAKVNFIDGDITDQEAFESAVVDNRITHILHLAALQVPMVRANPVLGARVNVVGSTIVMETAKRCASQIEGLVYASSIAVYGPATDYPAGPLAHDAEFLPTTLYGVNKLADEWTAKIYWQDYQVPSIGVRPFFVYGPARDQGMSSTPTKAMLAAAVGRPYHIPLAGSAVYQHAEDVANVVIRASKTQVQGAPCYNLGGSKATIDGVIDAIELAVPDMEGKISGGQGDSLFPEDMDQSALESLLGNVEWRDFNDGVKGTIEFFRSAVAAGKLDVERAIS